jgi:heme-degrading monooxygenase HmoA
MSSSKPLVNIGIFTPKPGRIDDFIATQLEGRPRLGHIPGLNTSRLYRAEDESRVIIIAGFDTPELFEAFQRSTAFQAEREKLKPLIDAMQPGFYRLIYDRAGDERE